MQKLFKCKLNLEFFMYENAREIYLNKIGSVSLEFSWKSIEITKTEKVSV